MSHLMSFLKGIISIPICRQLQSTCRHRSLTSFLSTSQQPLLKRKDMDLKDDDTVTFIDQDEKSHDMPFNDLMTKFQQKETEKGRDLFRVFFGGVSETRPTFRAFTPNEVEVALRNGRKKRRKVIYEKLSKDGKEYNRVKNAQFVLKTGSDQLHQNYCSQKISKLLKRENLVTLTIKCSPGHGSSDVEKMLSHIKSNIDEETLKQYEKNLVVFKPNFQ